MSDECFIRNKEKLLKLAKEPLLSWQRVAETLALNMMYIKMCLDILRLTNKWLCDLKSTTAEHLYPSLKQ